MRTPNCKCCICKKPLYRRPFETKKVRYVACRPHRVEAQNKQGQTKKQIEALKLGRVKGDNHLRGIPKSAESNYKRSIAYKKWCAENPDKVAARGAKCRGSQHYRWKGGSSRLNKSIRQMTENRRWMDAVKKRDGYTCTICGNTRDIETHHVQPLANLIADLQIKNRNDARRNTNILWAVVNGTTLCIPCHYGKHGRTLNAN